MMHRKILGIDLSAKDGKSTGFCLIMGNEILALGEFKTFSALKEYIRIVHPSIVSIDAPLNMPKTGGFRDCDLLLKRHGMSPLPPTMPSMRMLVKRAIELTRFLENIGVKYIETYPAGAIVILGFKRKPRSNHERLRVFREILRMFGLKTRYAFRKMSKDEFDAFICGVAGYGYVHGKYVIFSGKECSIILPKP